MISLLSSGAFHMILLLPKKSRKFNVFKVMLFVEAPVPEIISVSSIQKKHIVSFDSNAANNLIQAYLSDLRYHQIDMRYHHIDMRYHQIYLRYDQIGLRYHQIKLRYHQIDLHICPNNSD